MIPSISRIVRYVLPDGPSAGQERPAIITNLHQGEAPAATESTLVDLQVFLNGDGRAAGDHAGPLSWRTSVSQGFDLGQWHASDAQKPVPAKEASSKA